MKKKLLLVGLLGMLSTGAFAFSGEFTTQMEQYSYNTGADDYQESNSFTPGAALKIKPISGSSFYVGGAYSARIHSHDDKRKVDQRKRTDLYIGQDFKFGDFTYSPKFQFRNENYRDQNDGTSIDFDEYRFYNGMKYKINDKMTVFLSGFSALKRQDDDERNGDKRNVTVTYNDYHHDYELGTSYKLTSTGTGTISIWNELTNERKLRMKTETQLRFAYKQQVNDKISMTPYVRIGLQKADYFKDTETGAVATGLRHRFGLKADYQVSPTFKLFGEVYVQPASKHREKIDNDSIVDNDKNHTQIEHYVKVGFTQKF